MAFTLRESAWLDGWHVLTEDGRDVGGAVVEGTFAEWAEIADAIQRGDSKRFTRCAAVREADGGYRLFSPRNSQDVEAWMTPDEAAAFAASVVNQVGCGEGI